MLDTELQTLVAFGNDLKSKNVLRERFKNRVDTPIIIHSKDLRVDGDLLYIPIYMTMLL